MATTVAAFSAIDDTEVDAESPITESLMKRMRDNSYWVIQGTTKTTSTDTTKVLKPDGSNGVTWGDAGVLGTKGLVTSVTTTYTTLTSLTSGILKIDYCQGSGSDGRVNGSLIIDLSDDSFVAGQESATSTGTGLASSSYSGTITTGNQVGLLWSPVPALNIQFLFRRNSGNLQHSINSGTVSNVNFTWVIL